ncbi:MAG TPA: hypothetical protein VMV65_06555 [Alphaproteobacteria bacterium]|nr:hypothetical protein [Alphaproteobacteria bacterium]
MRIIFAAALAVAVLAPTAAAVGQTKIPFTSKMFRVGRCDPKANLTTAYAGYAPGFYPGRAYYWGDPYGYRFYQPPVATANPTLNIDFTNITDKVMTTVEWGLVANGRLVAEARDVGTFSPGAEIKHQYGLSPNVFPLQTGLPHCIALRVKFADGTEVRNPNLPHRREHLYVSPPPGH